jgi:hypothetical protein
MCYSDVLKSDNSHVENESDHLKMLENTYYIPTYIRFITEGIAVASQIILWDAHVLSNWLSFEDFRRDKW